MKLIASFSRSYYPIYIIYRIRLKLTIKQNERRNNCFKSKLYIRDVAINSSSIDLSSLHPRRIKESINRATGKKKKIVKWDTEERRNTSFLSSSQVSISGRMFPQEAVSTPSFPIGAIVSSPPVISLDSPWTVFRNWRPLAPLRVPREFIPFHEPPPPPSLLSPPRFSSFSSSRVSTFRSW